MSEAQKGIIGVFIFYAIMFAVLVGVSVVLIDASLWFIVMGALKMLAVPCIVSGLAIIFALMWKNAK